MRIYEKHGFFEVDRLKLGALVHGKDGRGVQYFVLFDLLEFLK